MNKIEEMHLRRKAVIYIRQSTQEQLKKNDGSRMRQYGLKDKAKEIGFREVEIIDDDLGISASGSYERSGFQLLLTELSLGKVGAIFAIEASRLARNGREWHTVLELCGVVKTLIIDHDGIYDPQNLNDRLLLGMKGTMSEMELSLFRQRSQEAIKQKAKLGKIIFNLAVGYVCVEKTEIEKDPDKRVQEAVLMVFKKFRELMSARQVLVWFKNEGIELPAKRYGEGGWKICWEDASYTRVIRIIKNPVYAGAYVYGQTVVETKLEGIKRKKVRKRKKNYKEWTVLIKDHHPGYINWNEYENNQKILTNNTNKISKVLKGSVRKGLGILNGLLRCGHCGHKLYVYYSGNNTKYIRYECKAKKLKYEKKRCISFSGLKVDRAVEKRVLEVLRPEGIKAAIKAASKVRESKKEIIEQKEMALKQARYEEGRARRQYDLVDPNNRLVANELEKRWEVKIRTVVELEEEIKKIEKEQMETTKINSEELIELGKNIEYIWNHEKSDVKLKKQILRTLIKEIIVKIVDNKIKLLLHWEGGDHTEMELVKNGQGITNKDIDIASKELIMELAQIMDDPDMAGLLNRLGKKTGKGNSWNKQRVHSYRKQYNIPDFDKEVMKGRKEIFVKEAAKRLGVKKRRLYTLIEKKILPAKRACFGAPLIIKEQDINKPEVRYYCENTNKSTSISVPTNQQELFPVNKRR